ncbi:MAG: hypothetical protein AB7G11_13100 [Phycisphaerales bacterium]
MKSVRPLAIISVLVAAGTASSPASASFVRFKMCVEHCLESGDYWDQVACILDCELQLARCVATLGAAGQVSYPSPDPACMFPNISGSAGGWMPGTPVPFRVQALTMTGPADPPGTGFDQTTYEAYAAQYAAPPFGPNASVQVRALPWNAPLNPGLESDASAAHVDPLWTTAGTVLFNGGTVGNLDTSGLAPGLTLVRVAVTEGGNTSYAIGAMNIVPSPGAVGLGSLGLLVAFRRRRPC